MGLSCAVSVWGTPMWLWSVGCWAESAEALTGLDIPDGSPTCLTTTLAISSDLAGEHRKTCDSSMWLECLTVCHLGSKSKHSKIPWGELQRSFPNLENHTTLLPPQFTCQNWVTGPAQIRREGTIYTRAWILAVWLTARAEGRLWTPATTHPETTIHSWVKNWGWFCIWLAWDFCKSSSPVSPT